MCIDSSWCCSGLALLSPAVLTAVLPNMGTIAVLAALIPRAVQLPDKMRVSDDGCEIAADVTGDVGWFGGEVIDDREAIQISLAGMYASALARFGRYGGDCAQACTLSAVRTFTFQCAVWALEQTVIATGRSMSSDQLPQRVFKWKILKL